MIRFVARWVFRGLLLAVVVAVGLYLIRDRLLRVWLRQRLEAVTGMETRLDGVTTDPGAARLALGALTLVNPPEFGGTPFLVVPRLELELDLEALRRREWRFRRARLHVADASLVRNARGETNVFRLLDRARATAGPADAAVAGPPGFEFTGIDTLDLTLGTLRLVDLGEPSRNRTLALAVTNEIVPRVRSVADLHPLALRLLFREVGNQLGGGLRLGVPTLGPPVPDPASGGAAPPPRPAR